MVNTLHQNIVSSVDRTLKEEHQPLLANFKPRKKRQKKRRENFRRRKKSNHLKFLARFTVLIGGISSIGYGIAFFPKPINRIYRSSLSSKIQHKSQNLAPSAKVNIWAYEICNQGYQLVEYEVYKTCVIPGVTHDDIVDVFGWDGRTISADGQHLVLRWETSDDRYFEAEFLHGKLISSAWKTHILEAVRTLKYQGPPDYVEANLRP